MQLDQFDPAKDGASVAACHEIYLSGTADDDPYGPPMSARGFAGWLALGWWESPVEAWRARDGAGQTFGWYSLQLPQRENRQLAVVDPVVAAARRRAGLGTALLGHAAARARQLGRDQLLAYARDGSPGAAFAQAAGARPGLTEIRRVLDLAAVPAGKLAALRAEAESAARGYGLLCWTGPPPEDQLATVVTVFGSAAADIPREDGHEAEHWDTERARQAGERVLAQGLRYYNVAARSLGTGEPAALTQLGVDPATPEWGFQGLTAVARPHRGHRLGLLVKLGLLDLLSKHEPQLIRVLTGNAAGNEHMVAINAALGFTPLDQWRSWELDTAPGAPA